MLNCDTYYNCIPNCQTLYFISKRTERSLEFTKQRTVRNIPACYERQYDLEIAIPYFANHQFHTFFFCYPMFFML